MRKPSPFFTSRRGSALLLVVACLLLLTTLVVAFLTKATLERQLAGASTSFGKTDLAAQGAIDMIIGDLQAEIVAGSNGAGTPAMASGYYYPTAPANAIPTVVVPGYTSSTIVGTGMEDLLKISYHGTSFYSGGPSRASSINTSSNPSLNNRQVTTARWNKPLLMTKATLTSTSDFRNANFTAPDWIFVARDGSNPTAWDSSYIFKPSVSPLSTPAAGNIGTNAVTQRYAYTIYDEGSTLDMNVAGSPNYSTTLASYGAIQPYKSALAYADLMQILGSTNISSPALSTANQIKIINAIMGWRNYSTAQVTAGYFPGTYTFPAIAAPSALRYFDQNTVFNTSGFMNIRGTSLSTPADAAAYPSQSDNAFSSRQQLIQIMTQGLGQNSGYSALLSALQNALPYLGTFSRDISQPSYAPPKVRPTIQAAAAGGNNATGLDDAINPSVLNVTAKTAFTRADASVAVVGEPLVKKRFNLSRIAWLTPKGPICTDDVGTLSSDATITTMINTYENTYGISAQFLQKGGPANILKYFGLQWDSANHRWNYVHGKNGDGNSITGVGTAAPGPIMKLYYTADESGTTKDVYTAGRDPDFFEMLKASVNAGSLAKTIASSAGALVMDGGAPSTTKSNTEQYNKDSSVDYAVMQLGANVIDQFTVDNFPTRILFNDGSGTASNLDNGASPATPTSYNYTLGTTAREFRGVKNLPYIYRLRSSIIKIAAPTLSGSAVTTTTTGVTVTPPGTTTSSSASTTFNSANPYGGVDYPAAPANGNGTSNTTTSTATNGSVTTTTTTTTSVSPTSTLQVTNTGVGALMMFPDLWNPHDYLTTNLSQTQGVAGPTAFRIYAVSADATMSYIGHTGGTLPFTNRSDAASTSLSPGYNSVYGLAFAGEQRGLSLTNTDMTFTIPASAAGAALFREPTILFQPGLPTGTSLSSVPIAAKDTSLGAVVTGNAGNPAAFFSSNGFKWAVTTANSDGATLPSTSGTAGYIGFYFGTHPLCWVIGSGTTANFYGARQSGALSSEWIRYYLQCQDAYGNWVTYDEKSNVMAGNPDDSIMVKPQAGFIHNFFKGGLLWSYIDPRTSRFGVMGTWPFNGYGAWPFPPFAGASTNPGWINIGQGITVSARNGGGAGQGLLVPDPTDFAPSSMGWYPGSWASLINPGGSDNVFHPGLFEQNSTTVLNSDATTATDGTPYDQGSNAGGSYKAEYYADPDGVVRRAMGGYDTQAKAPTSIPLVTAAAAQAGLPLATANTNGTTRDATVPSQGSSRPMILNRPFRSIADMGYAFSDTPWKNADLSRPESGYAALADYFTVNDTNDPGVLVAGKVNLNTRQALVLQSILASAYKDEWAPSPAAPTNANQIIGGTSATLAGNIATALVSRTTSATSPKGPLVNLSDLVGKWNPSSSTAVPVTGSSAYDGFSADLSTYFTTALDTTAGNATVDTDIARFREATIRALTNNCTTRVWNLMIDVITQTGRFPSSASALDKFNVEGERRYWVHVAIDRYTGKVLDEQIEEVKE